MLALQDERRAFENRAIRQVELRGLVTKAHDHVALLVQRGGARIFVPVRLG